HGRGFRALRDGIVGISGIAARERALARRRCRLGRGGKFWRGNRRRGLDRARVSAGRRRLRYVRRQIACGLRREVGLAGRRRRLLDKFFITHGRSSDNAGELDLIAVTNRLAFGLIHGAERRRRGTPAALLAQSEPSDAEEPMLNVRRGGKRLGTAGPYHLAALDQIMAGGEEAVRADRCLYVSV